MLLSLPILGYFGVGPREGVLVLEVVQDSPAEDVDLKDGDIILKVDGKDVGNVPFERCIASGCWARSQMPAELLKIFTTGKTAVFIIFDTPESGIGIPISLNGLAPAITALDKLN